MFKFFTNHPQSVNETYWVHMRHALGYSVRFAWLFLVVGIHAFLPFLFVNTGSEQIKKMYQDISNRFQR